MIVKGNNLAMIRGDTEYITLTIHHHLGESYIFQDGDVVYFTVKQSVRSNRKAIQKVVTVFPNNEVVIKIEPTDTSDLAFFSYVYDIQLNKANGDVKTVIHPSEFNVMGEVTYE